jgi:hypothetical protein
MSPLVECNKFFRPVFSHFSEKLVAVLPPIFYGQKYFFPPVLCYLAGNTAIWQQWFCNCDLNYTTLARW